LTQGMSQDLNLERIYEEFELEFHENHFAVVAGSGVNIDKGSNCGTTNGDNYCGKGKELLDVKIQSMIRERLSVALGIELEADERNVKYGTGLVKIKELDESEAPEHYMEDDPEHVYDDVALYYRPEPDDASDDGIFLQFCLIS